MKLYLAVNKSLLEGVSVTAENDGPIGIYYCEEGGVFIFIFFASEANYFFLG